MAVAALGELARQALDEAEDLRTALIPSAQRGEHPLSPRELQVLSLAAKGFTNREIAYQLGLSDRTIQFYLNSVFNKTGSASRTEAAVLAIRRGWIQAD
jgi:DNA-binding NarL/FixJ family response regulator